MKAATRSMFGGRSDVRCDRCGRKLTNRISIQRGVGPICYGQGYRKSESEIQMSKYVDEQLDIPIEQGFVFERTGKRMVPGSATSTNVPHLVVHHSPTGFEWGYGGSGPADTALNMIEAVLQKEDYAGPLVDCFQGQCFEAAFRVHQDAKWKFIATMSELGGTILYAEVVMFLSDHGILPPIGVAVDG